MALTARPTNVSTAPNISSGHMPAGGRNVASIAFSQIEELSPKAGVQADPNFNFQGFSDMPQRQSAEAREPLLNTGGNINTPSSTFLSLLGQQQGEGDFSKPAGAAKRAFQSVLSKAIRAYEGTAQVISGQAKPRGASFSLSL